MNATVIVISFFPAFADAAIAPIDFPTAPAYAVPKVGRVISLLCFS